MKTIKMILLLYFFIISTNILLAQDIWSKNKRVYDFASFGNYGLVILEGMNQDTLINNLTYKKIRQTEINVSSNFSGIDSTNSLILLREEGDKVFLFNGIERKLFDFSKNQGDTLFFMNFREDPTPVLKRIGDTLINGRSLRYQDIHLDDVINPSGDVVIRVVEGIGPINTFFLVERFYSAIPDLPFYRLRCFENDFIFFTLINVFGLRCDNLPIISSTNNKLLEHKKVFPNPFKDKFTIYEPKLEWYKIYNFQGQEIKLIKANNEATLEVDLSRENGFKFILVGIDNLGRIETINKLIKNGE